MKRILRRWLPSLKEKPIEHSRLKLKSDLTARFLTAETYFAYYYIGDVIDLDYAKLMIISTVRKMIYNIYSTEGLVDAFYSDMVQDIDIWVSRLNALGKYTAGVGKSNFVFHLEKGVEAKHMLFQYGDDALCKLKDYPGVQLEMGDILYDLIETKGDNSVPVLLYATDNMCATLYTLAEKETTQ